MPAPRRTRVAQPLDDEHGGAFAHDEAAAPAIERPACLLGIFVSGQHSHSLKPGGEQRVERFGTAGQGNVALTVENAARGGEHLDQSAGAGRRMAEPRPLQAVAIGDERTSRVGQPLTPPGQIFGVWRRDAARLLVKPSGVAHVSADGTAESAPVDFLPPNAGVFQCFSRDVLAQGNGLELAGILGCKINRCADGQAGGHVGHAGERTDAALASANCLPDAFAMAPNRCDQADAGDDDRLQIGVGLRTPVAHAAHASKGVSFDKVDSPCSPLFGASKGSGIGPARPDDFTKCRLATEKRAPRG